MLMPHKNPLKPPVLAQNSDLLHQIGAICSGQVFLLTKKPAFLC